MELHGPSLPARTGKRVASEVKVASPRFVPPLADTAPLGDLPMLF